MTSDTRCRDLIERYSEFLEGDLDAPCCRQLEEHLRECPDCFRDVDTLHKLRRMCQEIASGSGGPEPEAGLRLRLLARLEQE